MTNPDPMGVSRFGVDAKRLRSFFRQVGNGTFSTVYAMEKLELREPHASELMLKLAEAKWLIYCGQDGPYDEWELGQLGIQYSLKDFLRRIPVSQAEELLEKAICAAQEFNRGQMSTCITEIRLFGSLAKGVDGNGTIGDIDLDVTTSNRLDIDDTERQMRLYEEALDAPKNLADGWQRDSWARNSPYRHLRKVGKRLSVSRDNVEILGCEHRVVYRYDPETGTEIPCDRALVPQVPAKQGALKDDSQHQQPLPALPTFRPWPEAPLEGPAGDPMDIYVYREKAQYLWQRGWSVVAIADDQRRPARDIQAALAAIACSETTFPDLVYCDSPIEALAPYLAEYPDLHASIRLSDFGSGMTANVHLTDARHHTVCTASATRFETQGSPELYHLAEAVARAGALWMKRFNSKLPKIRPNISFTLHGYQARRKPRSSTMTSATAFGRAMNKAFDERLPGVDFVTWSAGFPAERSLKMEVNLLDLTMKVDSNDESRHIGIYGFHDEAVDLSSDLLGMSEEYFDMLTFKRRHSESE